MANNQSFFSTHQLFSKTETIGPILFLVAVTARLGAIGRYVTPDELAWVQRSINMRDAILAADWGSTIQAGHPGVVTTWLGAIGVQFTLWFNPLATADLEFVRNLAWINPISGDAHQHLAPFLTDSRLMIVFATSACIWLIYKLLAAQFSPMIAFSGALFIALDPWVAGLSGLLHVDALLATFIVIALLMVLKDGQLSSGRLILAGVFTALAILNKLPGILLLGLIPIIITLKNIGSPNIFLSIGKQLGWWFLGLVVFSAFLLPALWADPAAVIDIILADGTRIAGKRAPIYFLGSAGFDIGLHFYPLAVLIRQSPIITVGLALGAWAIFRRKLGRSHLLFIGTFLIFCLLFWGGITISSREFVRYALPISFILTLLGGLALGVALKHRPSLFNILIILQIGWMAWYWQFPLSTANLLTGGTWASVSQVALGWGEGVSEGAKIAAVQIAQDPSSQTQHRLFTTNVPAAAPFYPGEVFLLDDQTVNLIRPNDFVLIPLGVKQVSASRWTMNPNAPLAEQFPADMQPIHTVRFNGLERAWLYSDIPDHLLHANQDINNDTSYRFGEYLFLNAATLSIPENKFRLVVQTEWLAAIGSPFNLVLIMEDLEGNNWLRHEETLVGNSGTPSQFWSTEQSEMIFQKLTFPADLPPNEYVLKAEVFDEAGSRLGAFGKDEQFQGTSVILGQFESPLPVKQPQVIVENKVEPNSFLIGYSTPPDQIGQGEYIHFDVWWTVSDSSIGTDDLLLKIDELIIPYPVRLTDWRPGDIYRLKPKWQIPNNYPPGNYPISIGRTGDNIQQFKPVGQIMIEERDRSFTLPADVDPLLIAFGKSAYLQHFDATLTDQIELNLIWQANEPTDTNLTLFIHLKNMEGDIIGQIDKAPVKPTSLWIKDEVIEDRIRLDLPNEPIHEIAVGLYNPNDGRRVIVQTADGESLPDMQYTIELEK